MFARQALRSTPAFKHSIRRYAAQGSTSGGLGTSTYALIAAAAAGGGGALYWYNSGLQSTAKSNSGTAAPKSNRSNSSNPPLESVPKPSTSTFLGGDQGWFDLKLESVEILNHNTKKFRFALPSEDAISGLRVASAILTKYQGPEMEKPVIRPYTPTSDEDAKGHIDFVIKKYPNGPMSSHFHEMTPNQRLEFKGPIPKYPWQPNQHSHIALIAGGTGITPMYQLCRAIFKNPDDKTKVTLIFGNVTEEDILLKKELEHLENQYPQRFRAFYTVDKPSESWTQSSGHITQEVLKTLLPEPKTENLKIFVCGPPGLYKAISGGKNSPSDQGELSGYLKALGYSQEQVYKF